MKFFTHIFASLRHAWDYSEEPEAMYYLGLWFWRTLLIIFFCVIISAATLGIGEWQIVTSAISAPPPADTNQTPPPFTMEKLQSVLDMFSTRATEFQALSTTPGSAISDPSH